MSQEAAVSRRIPRHNTLQHWALHGSDRRVRGGTERALGPAVQVPDGKRWGRSRRATVKPDDARPPVAEVDFAAAPFLVIWETTRACDLSCRHCRAEAVPCRDPAELNTLEAMRLMNEVRQFGKPLFVLTGGDPLKRDDVVDLVAHGARLGLRVAMTPSGTPLMTPEVLRRLRDAGLGRLAVSLDGSTAEIHDAFRGVAGSYAWTLRMLDAARELGLSTQVNTTVGRHNLEDFDRLCDLMTGLGIVLWSVFFLVPTGRARPEDLASAEEFEAVFHKMYELARTAPFDIKSTAAPQYRRVLLQRQVGERRAGSREQAPAPLTAAGFSLGDGVGRAKGVNDGDGFVFISHTGEIVPSGFLPLSAGNVRSDDVVQVYRESPLFRGLRDRSLLKGKCGVCEYVDVCGGSRARAYALTGDYLEAEPFCTHVPARYRRLVEAGEAEPVTEYFARRVAGRRRPLPTFPAANHHLNQRELP
ncbi:MAG: TIGR04053 family radical SAM/SPASM domain-containing protein [Gemmatimonadetes bacterium]|nr:TIGR04053 family radical SAM/SPASM domain-containing protein [Gemmatimonadota bacterium]